jgi:hypothetical protein
MVSFRLGVVASAVMIALLIASVVVMVANVSLSDSIILALSCLMLLFVEFFGCYIPMVV